MTLAPGARLAMVSLMARDTLVWPLPLQVSLAIPAGKVSLTDTFVAVLRPVLLTVIVYVKLVPGTTVPTLPVIDDPPTLSVLVTPTSFCGVRLSLSVALLLFGLVSLAADTVTVFTSCAVAPGSTVAVTV